MSSPDVSVRTTIRRPAEDVWRAVADPSRIVSWSPEASGVRVEATGVLPVGAVFSGSNRNGLFRWSTTCRVIESTPGEAFAFDVSFQGMAVSRWRYALSRSDDGTDAACTVEEQWWDRRGLPMKVMGIVGTGVADRAAHNERTMRATLDALRAELEAAPD
ncbi:MAG: SRPBCC family protein [Actinobacteria bacterium]|nr:SRPBCC family protein [Actinomycetota bacterium]